MARYNRYSCYICGEQDHFFFKWSTSRYFNRRKVLDIVSKRRKLLDSDKQFIMDDEYRVCGRCVEKYKLMEH